MPGAKTNERPGTRAVLRGSRMSAFKAREVLDLIRGQDVLRAAEILRFSERGAAPVVGKVLASAVANARENDGLDPEDLFVSACFADEGGTLKRWRPRARGRATRIRKRTCHITVIVGVMPEEMLRRVRNRRSAATAVSRSRRRSESARASRRNEAAASEAAEASEGLVGAAEAVQASEALGTEAQVGNEEPTAEAVPAEAAPQQADDAEGGE